MSNVEEKNKKKMDASSPNKEIVIRSPSCPPPLKIITGVSGTIFVITLGWFTQVLKKRRARFHHKTHT